MTGAAERAEGTTWGAWLLVFGAKVPADLLLRSICEKAPGAADVEGCRLWESEACRAAGLRRCPASSGELFALLRGGESLEGSWAGGDV